MLYSHTQSNLTSLSASLLLPDIRWEPIICTCSSTMSFLPFYPFIPSTLPHFTCLSSLPPSLSFFPPAARILCLAIIYTHPAALLHPSFLFHFPLHLYVSQPPPDRVTYFMHRYIHTYAHTHTEADRSGINTGQLLSVSATAGRHKELDNPCLKLEARMWQKV